MSNNLAENCHSSAVSACFLSDKKTCNAGLHHTDGVAAFADLAFEVGLEGTDAPCAALDRRGNAFTPTVDRDAQKWRLAKAARAALYANDVRASVGACGLPGADTAAIGFRAVAVEGGGQRLAVDGVAHCGSARCPRCAPLRAADVSARVGAILKAADKQGAAVAFLTLTARHDRKTKLADVREQMGKAWSALQRGGLYRRLQREGLLGIVRVWEVTWGPRTGWHLHCHALVIHQAGMDAALQGGRDLSGRWIDVLGKYGLKAVMKAQDVRPVDADHGVGDYGAKTLRGWGAAAELAAGWHKGGKKPARFSIPDLLALAAEGDVLAGARYAEAVAALKGQRLLVAGPRLKAALALDFDDIADEQPPELEEQPEEKLGLLTSAVWKRAAVNVNFDHAWIIRSIRQMILQDGLWPPDVFELLARRVMAERVFQ